MISVVFQLTLPLSLRNPRPQSPSYGPPETSVALQTSAPSVGHVASLPSLSWMWRHLVMVVAPPPGSLSGGRGSPPSWENLDHCHGIVWDTMMKKLGSTQELIHTAIVHTQWIPVNYSAHTVNYSIHTMNYSIHTVNYSAVLMFSLVLSMWAVRGVLLLCDWSTETQDSPENHCLQSGKEGKLEHW